MNVKDYLFIEEFIANARVGVTVEERAHPQSIYMSLKIYMDLRPAGQRDDLNATLDYAFVIQTIRNLLGQKEFFLVETIAEYISEKILKEKIVTSVEIKVGKKVFHDIASVGVFIVRTK